MNREGIIPADLGEIIETDTKAAKVLDYETWLGRIAVPVWMTAGTKRVKIKIAIKTASQMIARNRGAAARGFSCTQRASAKAAC